jgi:acetyl-CoA carboxylase biotin carboxyl carrier protein
MSKSDKSPNVDADLVRQLAQLLEETGLNEIEYGKGDWHIRVSGGKTVTATTIAAPPMTLAPGNPAVAADSSDPDGDDISNHPGLVSSPMVGVVYTSSDQDTPDFVKVGDSVAAGDTLLLIEAMKVFNPIRSAKAGKVSRILINNGMPVEFGEPLLIIE